jgi:hypothetical protein
MIVQFRPAGVQHGFGTSGVQFSDVHVLDLRAACRFPLFGRKEQRALVLIEPPG